jgi:hypothetical protein
MKYKQNNNINRIARLANKGIITGNRLIDELDPDWYMLEWNDEEYIDYSSLHILNVIR